MLNSHNVLENFEQSRLRESFIKRIRDGFVSRSGITESAPFFRKKAPTQQNSY